MKRRIEFKFKNFKGNMTLAQIVAEGDRASLNRLFMLLANHPKIEEVEQGDVDPLELDGEPSGPVIDERR